MKVFKEVQRFTQTWLLVLLSVSIFVPIIVVFQEYLKEDTQLTATSFASIFIGLIVSVGLIFIFKLTTKIDEKGIHYQFFPFHFKLKLIGWNEIEKAYVRNYNPIGEYGGWGLKGGTLWNSSKGKAINVSGDIGIQLELKNGKKLLIGTQKKSELERVLETYKSKIN